MAPHFTSIHIVKSLKKADTQTKTCQRVWLPHHTDRLWKIKHENTTMYKNNSRFSSNTKSCSPLQLCCNLTGMCHAFGYYSYTNRYHQLKKQAMKELIKSKLEKYDYKYLVKQNEIIIKLEHPLEMKIDFSNKEKIVIKDKLTSWNFLTGIIEMNLKNTMLFNTIVFFIVAIIISILDKSSYAFNLFSYFLFVIILVAIWSIFYLIKAENFKKTVIFWIENSK